MQATDHCGLNQSIWSQALPRYLILTINCFGPIEWDLNSLVWPNSIHISASSLKRRGGSEFTNLPDWSLMPGPNLTLSWESKFNSGVAFQCQRQFPSGSGKTTVRLWCFRIFLVWTSRFPVPLIVSWWYPLFPVDAYWGVHSIVRTILFVSSVHL